MPQYSAQNRWNSPTFVGSNQIALYRPGMASAFTRNAGMKRSCSTSSDVKVIFTGAADRHVQLVDLALAVDVLEAPHPALAGRIDLAASDPAPARCWKKTTEAQTKMPIEMTNGMNDQPSSSGIEP